MLSVMLSQAAESEVKKRSQSTLDLVYVPCTGFLLGETRVRACLLRRSQAHNLEHFNFIV